MYDGADSLGQVWSFDNLPFLVTVPLACIAFAKFQDYWQSLPVQRQGSRSFSSTEEELEEEADEEAELLEAEKRFERRKREDEEMMETSSDINTVNNIFSFFKRKAIQNQDHNSKNDQSLTSCKVCPQCQGRKWFRKEVCDLCQGKGVIFLNEEDFYLPSKASPPPPSSDYIDVEPIDKKSSDRSISHNRIDDDNR